MNIRTLYEQERLSLTQIAAKTGEPMSRIRTQLLRMGVALRTTQEGRALRGYSKRTSYPRRRAA